MADKLNKYKAIKGIVIFKRKILLVKSRGIVGSDYESPGGRKLDKKVDDKTFLKKKIFTEVRIDVEVGKEILKNFIYTLPELGIELNITVYLCTAKSDKVIPEEDVIDFKWVPIEELSKSNCSEWIKKAVLNI